MTYIGEKRQQQSKRISICATEDFVIAICWRSDGRSEASIGSIVATPTAVESVDANGHSKRCKENEGSASRSLHRKEEVLEDRGKTPRSSIWKVEQFL